ncbi:MAG: metal-dependent hydrolase [Candidatus Micrarchaeota archaeon]|nr:metal-dependent hydrolase [Candidatus Micrarchaeota archaeon]
MDWKAHLALGAASGAIAALLLGLSQSQALLFLSISGFSALLPDLDLRTSKASQVLYALALALMLASALLLAGFEPGRAAAYFAAAAAFFLVLDLLFRPAHRGIMHSALFALACSAAAYLLLGWLFSAAFATGYLSHLLADRAPRLT